MTQKDEALEVQIGGGIGFGSVDKVADKISATMATWRKAHPRARITCQSMLSSLSTSTALYILLTYDEPDETSAPPA